MKAREHIDEAERILANAEQYPATQDVEIPALQLAASYALAHVGIARALQEEERLDGCTRHHGQSRP